ncbi:ANTAR domain-containing protein [Streptomyces sp. 2A115]|uniref:ANTAR domain-containing protein n=1 Tax=Streptomyces sp. 2A115 TaxID=3457439 RepID=UPI003FD20F0F
MGRYPEPGPPPEGHSDTTDEVGALLEQVSQLQEGMSSHAVIDQAIGVTVALGGISAAEAWDVLREASMNTNTKLRVLAEALVAWPSGGELPADVRAAVNAGLAERTRPSE